MKYLITNADDYGYRSDVTKAIIDAHKNGILTSTTVLINFVSAEDIELARQSPTLGFGLHLNITSGVPLTENWKNKYGEFSRPKRNEPEQFNREIWIPFFKKYEPEDIYLEYKAQVEKFIEAFDKLPTHLDSHHYTSAFQKVFPAFIKLAKEYNLPVRNQVLFDFEANQHPMGNVDHMPGLNKLLKKEGIKTTNYFSLLYLNRYKNYVEVIQNELEKIEDGESIEISCHPGYEEDWRKKDLEIIKDKAFLKLLEKVKLTDFTFDGH